MVKEAVVKTQCSWKREAWAAKSAGKSLYVPALKKFGSGGVANQLEDDYFKNFRRTLSLSVWRVRRGLRLTASSRMTTSRTSGELSLCRFGGFGAVCG
jgi:hypothetical protein